MLHKRTFVKNTKLLGGTVRTDTLVYEIGSNTVDIHWERIETGFRKIKNIKELEKRIKIIEKDGFVEIK